VNRKTNPSAHRPAALYVIRVLYNVASHLKILIPVGTAMIIVADVCSCIDAYSYCEYVVCLYYQ